jgi:hypothetical protein
MFSLSENILSFLQFKITISFHFDCQEICEFTKAVICTGWVSKGETSLQTAKLIHLLWMGKGSNDSLALTGGAHDRLGGDGKDHLFQIAGVLPKTIVYLQPGVILL